MRSAPVRSVPAPDHIPSRASPGRGPEVSAWSGTTAKRGGGDHEEVRYASTSLTWAAGQPVFPVTFSLR